MLSSVEESDFSRVLAQFIAACGGARACWWYSLKILSNDIPNLREAMSLGYNSTMYMFQSAALHPSSCRQMNGFSCLKNIMYS